MNWKDLEVLKNKALEAAKAAETAVYRKVQKHTAWVSWADSGALYRAGREAHIAAWKSVMEEGLNLSEKLS